VEAKVMSILITKMSPLSGLENTLEVDCDVIDYALWIRGMLIQDAMPDLPIDHREFLISGIYPGEWEDFCRGGGSLEIH
jgi:hypothetical protein